MNLKQKKEELSKQFNKLQEQRNQNIKMAEALGNQMTELKGAWSMLESLEKEEQQLAKKKDKKTHIENKK